MKTPPTHRPLIFLDFEGVLATQAHSKRPLIESALKDIGTAASTWREHQELWAGVFDAEPMRQLKAIDDQFDPLYCLASEWAAIMDRATMLNFLRVSGLGFVGTHLHTRWEVGPVASRSKEQSVTNWLTLNPEHQDFWVMITSEAGEAGLLGGPAGGYGRVVHCINDVGLTEHESRAVSEILLSTPGQRPRQSGPHSAKHRSK